MSSVFQSTRNTRRLIENDDRYLRSDLPSDLSENEIAWLKDRNITTILDLRSEEERKNRPCVLEKMSGFQYHAIPLTGGNAVPSGPQDVPLSYLRMCDAQMDRVLDLLLHAQTGVLYFCNAGKDRTGVVSALLLQKLGYGEERIVEDYMASRENLEPMLIRYAQSNPQVCLEVIVPRKQYILEFLRLYNRR